MVYCHNIVTHKIFENIILLIIVASLVTMIFEDPLLDTKSL